MKKNIGLWIDHREAVIVELTDKDEQIFHLKADAEKQIRFSGGSRQDGLQTTEPVRGKKLDRQLRERLSTHDVVKINKGITSIEL